MHAPEINGRLHIVYIAFSGCIGVHRNWNRSWMRCGSSSSSNARQILVCRSPWTALQHNFLTRKKAKVVPVACKYGSRQQAFLSRYYLNGIRSRVAQIFRALCLTKWDGGRHAESLDRKSNDLLARRLHLRIFSKAVSNWVFKYFQMQYFFIVPKTNWASIVWRRLHQQI